MSLQGNSLFTWLNREVRVSCTAAARSWWGLNWLRDTSIQQVKPGSSYFKVYPAVITNLTGSVRSPLRRSISLWGTGYQRKLSFQLKPPYVMSDPAMYSKVSSLITSMMGHTTVLLQQTHTHTHTHKHLTDCCLQPQVLINHDKVRICEVPHLQSHMHLNNGPCCDFTSAITHHIFVKPLCVWCVCE